MSYVIRNIRPSILHLPDAGLRLDSGQTAVVETLSPQMEELLANRALEAISSDPDPPVAPPSVEEEPVPAEATVETEGSASNDAASGESDVSPLTTPVAPGKKTRKTGTTAVPETADDAQ